MVVTEYVSKADSARILTILEAIYGKYTIPDNMKPAYIERMYDAGCRDIVNANDFDERYDELISCRYSTVQILNIIPKNIKSYSGVPHGPLGNPLDLKIIVDLESGRVGYGTKEREVKMFSEKSFTENLVDAFLWAVIENMK